MIGSSLEYFDHVSSHRSVAIQAYSFFISPISPHGYLPSGCLNLPRLDGPILPAFDLKLHSRVRGYSDPHPRWQKHKRERSLLPSFLLSQTSILHFLEIDQTEPDQLLHHLQFFLLLSQHPSWYQSTSRPNAFLLLPFPSRDQDQSYRVLVR